MAKRFLQLSFANPLVKIAIMLVGIILFLWVLRKPVEAFTSPTSPPAMNVGVTGGAGSRPRPSGVPVAVTAATVTPGGTSTPRAPPSDYNENFCKAMSNNWKKVEEYNRDVLYAEDVLAPLSSEYDEQEQIRVSREVVPRLRERYETIIKPILQKLEEMYEDNRKAFDNDGKIVDDVYKSMTPIDKMINEIFRKLKAQAEAQAQTQAQTQTRLS